MQNAPGLGYSHFAAVTASDTDQINCQALLVNVTAPGDIVVAQGGGGGDVTITLPLGLYLLPIALDQGYVKATGLTATATITALA